MDKESTPASQLKTLTAAQQLKQQARVVKKKDSWIRTRMWFSTLISTVFNDRGTIPPNIGNKIMITNNLCITKNSLSATIAVGEFSDDTLVGFCSDLVNTVKGEVENVKIDITIKNQPYWIDTKASGMRVRATTWTSLLNSPHTSERQARRSARQLYTLQLAKSGEQMYKSRVYVKVRARDGRTLNRGIKSVTSYLESCAIYRVIRNDLKMHLDYMSMLSNISTRGMKNVGWMVTSQQALAELFPQTQGLNDEDGTLFGLTHENNSTYYINLRSNANAKSVYVLAKSGFGKTFKLLGIIIDGYADGFNICIMDIKGTEFTQFTKACNGVVLSMRSDDTHFVNTFVLDMKEVENSNYGIYYNRRIRLSKKKLLVMCQFSETETAKGETLIDEFLTALYSNEGVSPENPNTWTRTESFHPYIVFEKFEEYLSREIKEKYGDIAISALSRLRIYMSRKGNSSHIHRDQYSYKEVLDTRVLTFDFGILEDSASNVDPVIFQLRVMDMEIINEEFVSKKKKLGQWTMKILEESQICADYLLEIYVREVTLRRAQNQITFVLGNSLSALQDNPVAKPLLESINILLLGVINESNQKYLVEEYDLGSENKKKLEAIAHDTRYMHNFLIVNRMQADATTALVKTYVPKDVRDGKLFKNVDVVEQGA